MTEAVPLRTLRAALLVLCVSACATVEQGETTTAQPPVAGAMSISEAFKALKETVPLDIDVRKPGSLHRVDESGIETTVNNFVLNFRFRDTPDPQLRTCNAFSNCAGEVRVDAKGSGPKAEFKFYAWRWAADRKDAAERFVVAFRTLAAGVPPESPEEAERFRAIATHYRAAAPRPGFPEAARRFRVQGENAFKEKRFDDAVDRFEEALKLAPWWPEGRFNRSLVLGELGRHTEAIREMKKYLMLAPDAPNARTAQDQIYAWEDKVKR